MTDMPNQESKPTVPTEGQVVEWLEMCPVDEGARRACLSGEPEALRRLHHQISKMLIEQADPDGDASWRGPASALLALPYHQIEAGRLDELRQTLCELRFVEARFRVGTFGALVRDYRHALAALDLLDTAPSSTRRILKEFLRFVGSEGATFELYPALVLQQAANQAHGSAVEVQARALFRFRHDRRSWLRWLNAPEGQGSRFLVRSLEAHAWSVCLLVPDQPWVVVGSYDHVMVWDRTSGELVGRCEGWPGTQSRRAYCRDGQRVIDWGGEDIVIRSLPKGERVHQVSRQLLVERVQAMESSKSSQEVHFVDAAWSPDDTHIAALLSDGRLGIWSVDTNQLVQASALELRNYATTIAWSPSGDALLIQTATCQVWSAFPLELRFSFDGNVHVDSAWSPDGNRLLTYSTKSDGRAVYTDHLAILDAKTGECLARMLGAQDDPQLVDWVYGGLADGSAVMAELDRNQGLSAFSPDGTYVLAETGIRDVSLYEAATGRCVQCFATKSLPRDVSLWAPTGARFLLIANGRNDLDILDFSGPRRDALLQGVPGFPRCLDWSSTGDEIAIVSHAAGSYALSLWQPRLRSPDQTQPEVASIIEDLDRISFGPGEAGVGAVALGSQFPLLLDREGTPLTTSVRLYGLACLAWSPDGARVVFGQGRHPLSETTSGWGAVNVYPRDKGKSLWQGRHDNIVVSVAWSPEGSAIGSCSWAPYAEHRVSQLRIWDSENGTCLLDLSIDGDVAERVYWSPDSSRLMCESRWGSTLLCDLATLETQQIARDPKERGCFSDDGACLVFAKPDGKVRKYSLAEKRDVASLSLPLDGVQQQVAFGAQERIVAFFRPYLQVWDWVAQQRIWLLPADRLILCLNFAPCGTRLAVGSKGGQVLVFAVRSGSEADVPLATLIRQFSVSQARFEDSVSLRCPRCGNRRQISQDEAEQLIGSAHGAPSHAACAACHGALRIRPNVVDRTLGSGA